MNIKGISSLLAYSLLIGTLGFFTRAVQGLDLITIVFFRAFLAAIFIFGFAAVTKTLKDLIPSNIPTLVLASICQCGMMVLFIGAVLNTSIANAVFINQIAPICAVLFSRVFLGEKISRTTLIGMLISTTGVLCMLDLGSLEFGSNSAIGDLMALGSAVCYAGAMVSSKSLTRTNSTTSIAFWQMALSAAMLVPFIQIPSSTILIEGAGPLLGIGFLVSGFGYLLFMVGVKNLNAQTVLIIPSFGLVVPAAGAWLLYGETLATTGFIGCGLILAGVLSSQIKFQEAAPAPVPTTSGALQPA